MTRASLIDLALAEVSRGRAALDRVRRSLEALIHEGGEEAVTGASNTLSAAGAHRRAHRPGRAAKIDCDIELRTFIVERIDTMTFVQLESAIAAAFPPERRVRKTAIHAWLRKSHSPTK